MSGWKGPCTAEKEHEDDSEGIVHVWNEWSSSKNGDCGKGKAKKQRRWESEECRIQNLGLKPVGDRPRE